MAVEISWYIPNRIIYAEFKGQNTAADIQLINQELPRMLDSGTPPVHWILYLHQDVRPFLDTTMLHDTQAFLRADRLGVLVIVGQKKNRLLNMMVKFMGLLYGFKYHYANSIESALTYLKALDHTLERSA